MYHLLDGQKILTICTCVKTQYHNVMDGGTDGQNGEITSHCQHADTQKW